PGIGLDDETARVARGLVHELRQPMAVDADALTALAGHLDGLRDAPAPRCLTPHPGEMARMLGARVDEVQRDRIETVREFATRHGVHIVLKGARSVIGAPVGRVFVNPMGNRWMVCGDPGVVVTVVPGSVVALTGELGAGKTCFVQGLVRGLGATVRATSPTFVLVNQYEGRVPVHHVDAYRTDSMTELMELGLLDLIGGDGVTVIEWADKLIPLLP